MKRKGRAEMKDTLSRMAAFQQAVQKRMERLIDRLARNAIAQEERKYELLYGKPLSEQEKIEIKKGVVLRLSMFLLVPLLIIVLTLMNRGVMS